MKRIFILATILLSTVACSLDKPVDGINTSTTNEITIMGPNYTNTNWKLMETVSFIPPAKTNWVCFTLIDPVTKKPGKLWNVYKVEVKSNFNTTMFQYFDVYDCNAILKFSFLSNDIKINTSNQTFTWNFTNRVSL